MFTSPETRQLDARHARPADLGAPDRLYTKLVPCEAHRQGTSIVTECLSTASSVPLCRLGATAAYSKVEGSS